MISARGALYNPLMSPSRAYEPAGSHDPVFANARRADLVRLRTLVTLRWIAITGQLIAVAVASIIFGLELQHGPILATIGAAVITNLVAGFLYPETRRLTETELIGVLIFDMMQLSVLLALTGGLNNPFALLILAQVAIAATALRFGSTLAICAFAIVLVTVLARVHLPLATGNGRVLELPELFLFGNWIAIVVGILFQAGYAQRVTSEMAAMADALAATQMALSREQKLTDLGGVVAAAAHELGTPLATIALVSGEMLDEIDDDSLREDAQLIRDQAERCRLILRSMGRSGKDDLHLQHAPICSVVEEAAEPHQDRGAAILYDLAPDGDSRPQPVIPRRPEIIHGIRNLVQNAVDFAHSTVWIEIRWSEQTVSLRISDDGPGYPPELLPLLGDPFLTRRGATGRAAPRRAHEGMGLGLFIAKTLLERSGAEIVFANGHDPRSRTAPPQTRRGAMVLVTWSRSALQDESDGLQPFGENRVFAP